MQTDRKEVVMCKKFGYLLNRISDLPDFNSRAVLKGMKEINNRVNIACITDVTEHIITEMTTLNHDAHYSSPERTKFRSYLKLASKKVLKRTL